MMKKYTSDDIDVTYDHKKCIHAAVCVSRLGEVFDVKKRPWIQPEQASAERIAETVAACPSGALQFERHDGGEAESPPAKNVVVVTKDGPLYVSGKIVVEGIDGEVVAEGTRLALCRCGASDNKPLCDNAHKNADFKAASTVTDNQEGTEEVAEMGELVVRLAKDGPLLLRGDFEVRDEGGTAVFRGQKAALCRCGGSLNKPFCDGTHGQIGFEG
ncbi:MAG TPA: CDGSH iron-sulfur domain-containing protein [Anaerolineae bacterium]|nr:CDGSH iron-sulfur domain-containing protein [Anaerolineae bacterium]